MERQRIRTHTSPNVIHKWPTSTQGDAQNRQSSGKRTPGPSETSLPAHQDGHGHTQTGASVGEGRRHWSPARCRWGRKTVQLPWLEQYWARSRNRQVGRPNDPTRGICPGDTNADVHAKACAHTPTAALFVTARRQKQPERPDCWTDGTRCLSAPGNVIQLHRGRVLKTSCSA